MTDLLQYLDIIKQKDAHDSTLQPRFEVVKAYLVDVQSLGTPFVSSRPGFVWVREYGANGGVFQAFLSQKVQARVDLPVLVMHSPVKPFLRQVVDVDWSEMINYEGFDDQPLLGLHAPDHEWPDFTPGADPVNVYLRALVPLKTFPNTGLTVNVSPFVYEVDNEIREYFGEIGFDLSEFQPASGEAVRVLVYFDVESNSVQAVAGNPVADVPTITPPTPAIPENAYQSALIRLDGDQTTFAELDIKDVRSLFEISTTSSLRGATLEDVAVAVGNVEYLLADHIVNHPGGGGTPGGSPTQLQYNDDGDFAGTSGLTWNSTTSTLTHTKSTSSALEAFLVLDQNGSGGAYMYMYAGSTYGRVGMTSSYFDISSPEDIVITGDNVVLTSANDTIIDAGGYLATVFQGGGSDPAAIFNNPNWGNYHFQIKTENNDFMVWVDSGIDAFQIGTDVAGTIADFRSTAIVFNDAEADVDFTHKTLVDDAAFHINGASGFVGVGISAPTAKTHIVHDYSSSSVSPALSVQTTWSPSTTSGSVFPAAMQLIPKYDTTHSPSGGFLTSLRLFASVENSGAIVIRNVDLLSQNHGSGTVDNIYDIFIRSAVNDGGGSVTNYYGLYIADQTVATNNYAIYQIGANVVNYFQGKVGINTNAPQYPLHVYGGLAVFQINTASLQGMNRFYNANTTDGNGVVLNFDTDTTGVGATVQQFMAQIAVEFTTHDHPTRTGRILFRPMANGSFQNPALGISAGVVVGSPSGSYPGAGALSLDAHLNLDEMGSTPASPVSGTMCNVYMKADKFIIQFNNGGTVRYKYLDLTGTGVTWTHTTTAP